MAILSVLLSSLLCSSFVVPCLTLVLLLTPPILRAVMCMIWNRIDDQFTWPTDSEFHPDYDGAPSTELAVAALSSDRIKSVLKGTLSSRLHNKHGAVPEGEEHAVQCVFCLCDIAEGEEVRELRCDHLFHRSCLDRWVGFGRVTCPLCRKSLTSKVPEVELPCEEAVDDLGAVVPMLADDAEAAWWAT